PSGRGLHMFALGKLPDGGRKKGHIEVYDSKRYFTVTGNHVPGTPLAVQDRSDRLRELYDSLFGTTVQVDHPQRLTDPCIDAATVLARARAAKNGAKFARLFDGDWSDYASQSEADMALCMMLAFWCSGDPARIDQLFRRSGLY